MSQFPDSCNNFSLDVHHLGCHASIAREVDPKNFHLLICLYQATLVVPEVDLWHVALELRDQQGLCLEQLTFMPCTMP